MYLLWSGKLQGWLTRSSTYSTIREEAKQFTRDDALAMVKRHRDHGGTYNLLPIRLEDLT